MSVERQLSRVSPASDTAVTIGAFDGVHLGHQHLFRKLREHAQAAGLQTCAIVFRNQPRAVLNPSAAVEYITPWEQRKALIKAQGIDHLAALDFTLELASIRARKFVSLLVELLRMRLLVVGPDFALGHRREGDTAVLAAMGKEMGFGLLVVEPELADGRAVRSSILRPLIRDGRIEEAAKLLGRPFSVTGAVLEGDRRGRSLGFPTANLSLDPDLLIPKHGIYATRAVIDGRRMPSATSIGVRPTFGPGPRMVEVYVMDFDSDLYGKTISVEFVQFLRDEQRFETVEELVDQMNRDVEQARAILGEDG